MTKLQIVGGGKMGQALIGGMISSQWAKPEDLVVVELSESQRRVISSTFPGVVVLDEPRPELDTILAVKPPHIVTVASTLKRPTRVASIAAGITISSIEAVVPAGTPVIRIMPNTPALVGVGASAAAAGNAATENDMSWALSFLGAVGEAVEVTEPQLSAVTGLSGSGPAYFFLMAEALADAGVTAGLPRSVASLLANQTMAGAAAMLQQTGEDPVALRAGVTTPAGTTAAGLGVLERNAVRAALIDAVAASAERSLELGALDQS